MSSRFETVSGVDIVYEAVSPQINIYWNPESDKGSITFQVEHQEWRKSQTGDLTFAGRAPDKRNEMRPLVVPLERFVSDVLDIALPDGTTMQLSGGMLVLAVKSAFNKYYEQKEAEAEAEADADAEVPPSYDVQAAI